MARPPLAPPPPWESIRDVEAVTSAWLESGVVRSCLALERLLPSRSAEHAPRPALHPALEAALTARGIEQLYTHQVKAITAAQSGRHTIIATPTASGKSLCFHLPVLDRLAKDSGATALFLYPTKALSRDQERGIHGLVQEAGLGGSSKSAIGAIVFDGDTPGDVRQKAREKGRIVLTNPDMLHSGILPNHTKWAAFFQGLSFVVLDELHTYRGVFGSHMAHVLTRLRRILAFYGAAPTFIGATATIGNPLEHASRLLGFPERDIELVDQSGAPQSPRRVFVYNPPVVNAELGVRQSSLKAAVRLTADLVRARVPTILFGPSRNSVEVMLKYLRERCAGQLADPQRAIMGYRGGYLPQMRRDIERGLKEGEILCVVSTNALELGIDIGELDAVVCAGYPGSIAGTWQRFGRAGRRGRQAALVLVCSSGAVDQYLAQKPEYLLETSAEQARLDPRNTEILVQHLKCAAFEAPFCLTAPGPKLSAPSAAVGESYGPLDTASTRDALEYLTSHGVLHASGGVYRYTGEAFPASHVSLRNVGWDNFVIIEQYSLGQAPSGQASSAQGTAEGPSRERTIGELDFRAAHTMLHEQAIYQQDAEQYQVERLDFENHKAYVRKVLPDYFTTALTYRTVTVLETLNERRAAAPALSQGFGDVKVVEKVTGYKKIKFFTHENSGYGDVHLPPMEMHTTSYWLSLSEGLVDSFAEPRAHVVDALSGFGQALAAVASLALMCDPKDLASTMGDGDPEGSGSELTPKGPVGRDARLGHVGRNNPTLFLFDVQPGGVGLAEHIYHRAEYLIEQARDLILGCNCAAGCPACVGPTESSPRKQLALALATRLVALLGEASSGLQ